jgi:hypothetical protein
MGDVTIVYKFWVDQALVYNVWVGIDTVWVYPIVAMIPMLAAFAFGSALYASTWLSLIMMLNAVAFAVITGWRATRNHARVAWWWIGFLVALGPIALGRIDSVTVPLAIVGMLILATRPCAASALLTVATWIKVWPAALLAAIVIAVAQRRQVVATALVVSVTVAAVALAFGSGANVVSFITQQTGRGLQVEAPISTIWMWFAAAGVGSSQVYYDQNILTYQVRGLGADFASVVMTPILGFVALAVCALGLIAARRRVASAELLPVLSLALVAVLIAFNKVGSPQFVMWLAVPVIAGLVAVLHRRRAAVRVECSRGGIAASGRAAVDSQVVDSQVVGAGARVVESFRVPATLVLVIAALTQVIYPFFYTALLSLNPVMLVVVSIRNLLYFVLVAWSVTELIFLCGKHVSSVVQRAPVSGFPDDAASSGGPESASIDWSLK